MPRSVPDNDVMEKQQAADRKPARKSTKSKAKAKPEQDSKAMKVAKAAKAKATASSTTISRAKAKGASSAPGKKTAPRKATSDRGRQAKTANEELRKQAQSAERPKETSAQVIESDVRANRGLGRLFGFFRRSRGRRKLEQPADTALGKKK
jgi:hypothetical protein